MRQIEKKLAKVMMAFALVAALFGSVAKVNAASTGSITINTTYGTLKGRTVGDVGYPGKYFESSATTTKAVPRLWSDIDIKYYTTGNTITTRTSGWCSNSKLAVAGVYMSQYKNAQNGNRKDGFVNTRCTAYGCAEAIVKKAYTVYTSYVL